MTTRRIAAAMATTIAALTLTACGSAPSEASCKAAAYRMMIEALGGGIDHSDSPKPRECEGFTDAQIQTFVFGAPLDTSPIEEEIQPMQTQPAGCVADVKAQVAAGATSIVRRAVACEGVSDDEIYMIAMSR